ncbi:MAG: hypothetical protein EZS28_046927, partial [Streblomastix strix]
MPNCSYIILFSSSDLRSYVFSVPLETRYNVKAIVGKIVPSVASTNAITAGLSVEEVLKMLKYKDDIEKENEKTNKDNDQNKENKVNIDNKLNIGNDRFNLDKKDNFEDEDEDEEYIKIDEQKRAERKFWFEQCHKDCQIQYVQKEGNDFRLILHASNGYPHASCGTCSKDHFEVYVDTQTMTIQGFSEIVKNKAKERQNKKKQEKEEKDLKVGKMKKDSENGEINFV